VSVTCSSAAYTVLSHSEHIKPLIDQIKSNQMVY